MIGYYVHHHGRGHVTRAGSLLPHLPSGTEVTGLSSLPRPKGWPQLWVQLDPDADADPFDLPEDATAGGTFHWVPRGHSGLRSRMSTISRWIDATRPDVVVVDTSVEVATLCRLHGVPVVSLIQPGDRTDPPHTLGLGLAERLVAPWPADVADVVRGVAPDDPRLVHVGAFSRFDGREPLPTAVAPTEDGTRNVVVLSGAGGSALTTKALDRARASTPGWTWTLLGGPDGTWVDDPWAALCRADVVVTHAGQNALAEVAAARRPAVVIPQERPHDEQRTSAAALAADGRLPVVVLQEFADDGWPDVLDHVAGLDGCAWQRWNDGQGARRLAAVVLEVAGRVGA
ncbi:MAG: hypothetical protein EOO67_03090 [Microbacterium sp.]|nr:MAG: hypothetical protein EOO67_03090 [Microbacterium sp.]